MTTPSRINRVKSFSARPINFGLSDIVRTMRTPKSEGVKMINNCNNNITQISKSKCSEFIFFGCWNNIDCEKEYIYRDIVLDYIAMNETNIKQLYIAGDNWYTNIKTINEKNFKFYLTDILIGGYVKLYSMNKEIYIAVGNHDEDKDDDKTSHKLKKNCNINTQKHYLKQIKDILSLKKDVSLESLNIQSKQRDILSSKELVSLESLKVQSKQKDILSLIDEVTLESLNIEAKYGLLTDNNLCKNGVYIYTDDIGVRYNNGNIVIIINTNKFDDYDVGVSYLKNIKIFINKVENAKTKNKGSEQIFVMGHIPLFSFKKDKINIHNIDKTNAIYNNLILDLYDILVEYNVIYICADTHNFSIMKINCGKKVLIQITAGTGGADPDLLKREYIDNSTSTTIEINEYNFKIDAYALNSYGYVKIKTTALNDIEVCYKQLIKDKTDMTGMIDKNKTDYVVYKINKNDKSIIVKVKYVDQNSSEIINIQNYKNTDICNKIKTDNYGYITDKTKETFCYKKPIKVKS